MNSHLGVILLPAALLLAGLASSHASSPAQEGDDKLAQDLAATRLRVEAVSHDLTETREKLEAVLKYLDAQSKAARGMARTLDESEKAGFTYGMNPESRHVLLKGWRAQLSALQKDVPGAKAATAGAARQP